MFVYVSAVHVVGNKSTRLIVFALLTKPDGLRNHTPSERALPLTQIPREFPSFHPSRYIPLPSFLSSLPVVICYAFPPKSLLRPRGIVLHTQDARSTRLSHDMCGCFTLPQNGDGNIQARDCHREGAGRNKDQCGV